MNNNDRQQTAKSSGRSFFGARLQALVAMSVRQDILRFCLVLCSPLIVTILVAKTLMLLDVIFPLGLATFEIYVSQLGARSIGRTLALLVFITGLFLVSRALLRQIRMRQLLILCLGCAFVLALAVALANGSDPVLKNSQVRWIAEHAMMVFDAFRWDLLFVSSFVLTSLYALARVPEGRHFCRVKWLIIGVQIPLILVSSLEFAYYIKTGVTGSGPLFFYAVSRLPEILPIIGSEIDRAVTAALLVPVLAILLKGVISHPRQGAAETSATGSRIRLGAYVLPIMMTLAFAPKLNANANFFQFEQNIHFAIASHAIASPAANRELIGSTSLNNRQDMLFDTSRLELVATERSRKSNVILIILESVGANSTSVNDEGPDNTPFLKTLAEQSAVVEQMYVVVPRTLAAWISVLQGVYPAASNVTMRWGDKIERAAGQNASLPGLLRPFGYQSAFFTPTHLDYENEHQLISNIGFDKIVSKHDYQSDEYEIVNYFGWEDRIMTQPILEWVDKQVASESPLFLTVMTNVGHHDYKPPQSWPVRSFGSPLGEQHNDYLNSLAYIDAFLQDLFSSLDDRGVLDDSLIVIVGDHGESFGEHGRNHHMAVMYEESLRVPAIIHSSFAKDAARRVPGVWQLPDIFPTVIDVLGYEMKNGTVAGKSIFDSVPENRRVYFAGALDNSYLGMREGNLKYVYYFGRRPTQVFDISNDREEKNDICDSIDAAVIREAENDMLAWYQSTEYSLLGGVQ